MPFYLYKFEFPGPLKIEGLVGEYPTLATAQSVCEQMSLENAAVIEADAPPIAGDGIVTVALRTRLVWNDPRYVATIGILRIHEDDHGTLGKLIDEIKVLANGKLERPIKITAFTPVWTLYHVNHEGNFIISTAHRLELPESVTIESINL